MRISYYLIGFSVLAILVVGFDAQACGLSGQCCSGWTTNNTDCCVERRRPVINTAKFVVTAACRTFGVVGSVVRRPCKRFNKYNECVELEKVGYNSSTQNHYKKQQPTQPRVTPSIPTAPQRQVRTRNRFPEAPAPDSNSSYNRSRDIYPPAPPRGRW